MTDSADRLHNFASNMKQAVEKASVGGNTWSGYLFSDAIPVILQKLELKTFLDLNNRLIKLCEHVENDFSIINFRRPSVKDNWKATLVDFQNVFDFNNYPQKASQVLQRHFSTHNLSTLETISDRLQTDQVKESSEDDLRVSLDAVRDAISELEKAGDIDIRLITTLRHYLYQMNCIYEQYNVFGPENFWPIYKQSLATFIQFQQNVAGSKNAAQIVEKIRIIATHAVFAVGFTAGLVADGTQAVQFFLPHLK